MLPRLLYEILPYSYILTGIVIGMVLNSSLIFLAGALLIATGVSILFMRYTYRRRLQAMIPGGMQTPVVRENYVSRRRSDRRQRLTSQFPLIDCNGTLVTRDRRCGERRRMAS